MKSDSRKAVFAGMTYSSPISVTTEAQSALFSVTRENKSTWDVEPSSATSSWTRSSCSSTRGSALAISQRAARPHSWDGRASVTGSVTPFRYPRDWEASTNDLVPPRITDLICIHTHYRDYLIWVVCETKKNEAPDICASRSCN